MTVVQALPTANETIQKPKNDARRDFNRAIDTKLKPPKRSQAEKRIDFLQKRYFDDDPNSRTLLSKLATLDPTPKKKYLAWLVKYWTAGWKPDDAERGRVTKHLAIHLKGAKYFSPLTWTGLELEEVGYQADIYKYSPNSLRTLNGRVAEIIQIDEENKQIRKGNLVITGGAEVAYKDENWTLLRIRTKEALRRLGQGTSWCVRNGNLRGFKFPFDFLINNDGERFLANEHEIRDCRDSSPLHSVNAEITRIRALGVDSYDRIKAHVRTAIKAKQRLELELEDQIMQHADLAITYASKVIRGPWVEFEKSVRVATLPALQATEYAIKARRERWPRFENKIKRSQLALADYRKAFPGSIPKSDEEIFEDKLAAWRRAYGAKCPVMHWSVGWQAESRERNIEFETSLLGYSEASITRYARIVSSLSTSEVADAYSDKYWSYFTETDDEQTAAINQKLGPIILDWLYW